MSERQQTVLEYILSLRPALPFSITTKQVATNMEVRRWFEQKAIVINSEPVTAQTAKEPMNFPVFSLVFFPAGNRRTTLI